MVQLQGDTFLYLVSIHIVMVRSKK